jgi:hypothetical protein
MNTKSSLTILFILFSLSATLLAQETELDKRNGFKDIKMATPIDSIKGAKFKKGLQRKRPSSGKALYDRAPRLSNHRRSKD